MKTDGQENKSRKPFLLVLIFSVQILLLAFFVCNFFVMDDYEAIHPSLWWHNVPIDSTQIDSNFGILFTLNISTSITLFGLALSVISILISKSRISITSYMKHIVIYDRVITAMILYQIALVVTFCTAYLRYTYFVDLWLKISLSYPVFLIILVAYNISKIESSKFIFQEMSLRIAKQEGYLDFYSDIFIPYNYDRIYQETTSLILRIYVANNKIGFMVYEDISSKLFEKKDEEAKLEFLIQTAYYIRPLPSVQSYKDDMSKIIDAIFDSYRYCIITKKQINATIILNLKELVYYHTFSLDKGDFTSEEKRRILSTYSKVIETAARIIGITVTNPGISSQLVINQINNYIAYTQFWNSMEWNESQTDIYELIKQHEYQLNRITYRILYLIITERLNHKSYFRACRQIIDEFGFKNYEESFQIFFEDLIIPSTFHSPKYTFTYLTHVFLCAIAVIESEEVVRDNIVRWLDADNIANRTSELRAFLKNIDNISYLDIQPIALETQEKINKGKEIIKTILSTKLEVSIKNDNTRIEKTPISEDKLNQLITDMKEQLLFKDLVLSEEDKRKESNSGQITFSLKIPKKAVIEQHDTIFMGMNKVKLMIIEKTVLHLDKITANKKIVNISKLEEIKLGFEYLILSHQFYRNQEFISEFDSCNFFIEEIKISNRKFKIRPTAALNNTLIFALSSPLYFGPSDAQITMGRAPEEMNCEPMINLNISISYTYFNDFSVVKYLLDPIDNRSD